MKLISKIVTKDLQLNKNLVTKDLQLIKHNQNAEMGVTGK